MELNVFHNTSFVMVNLTAMMAVMKSVIFHHVNPFLRSSSAKMEADVWVLLVPVMELAIVMMEAMNLKMNVTSVLLILGGGFVKILTSAQVNTGYGSARMVSNV